MDLEGHITYSIWEIFREMTSHVAHLRLLRFRLPPTQPNSLQDATPLTQLFPNIRSLDLGTLTALYLLLLAQISRIYNSKSEFIVTHILGLCTKLEQLRLLGGISRTNIDAESYGVSEPGTESLEASSSLHTFVSG